MVTLRNPAPGWARWGAITVVGLAIVGLAGLFGAAESSTSAQVAAGIEPISTLRSAGGPVGTASTSPSVADSGDVVAFTTTSSTGEQRVAVRQRSNDSTRFASEGNSAAASISGDGCVVAYIVPTATVTRLLALDRCAGPNSGGGPTDPFEAGVVVGEVGTAGLGSTPALSTSGAVIVWSDGADVRRYVRSGSSWSLTDQFDASLSPSVGTVTGPRVDVSGDGSTIVFTAGPGAIPATPSPSNVYAWTLAPGGGSAAVDLLSVGAAGGASTGSSSNPTISSDGSIVLFQSDTADLGVAGSATTATPFVVMIDRVARTSGVIAASSRLPSISADGHHAAYERGGTIRTRSWATGAPFAASTESVLTTSDDAGAPAVGPTLSSPQVAGLGSLVVFDSGSGASLTTDARFHGSNQVWSRSRPPTWSGSKLDFGTRSVGGTVTGVARVQNTGQAAIAVGAVLVSGTGFSRGGTTCSGILQPASVCTVDVRASTAKAGTFDGKVSVGSIGGVPPDAVVVLRIVVTAPGSTTPTTSTTQPQPPVTSPPVGPDPDDPTLSTTPIGTVPEFVIRPPVQGTPGRYEPPSGTRPYTPYNPYNPYNPYSPSDPYGTYSDPPGTAAGPTNEVAFSPASFDFAPTIANAGARVGSIELINGGAADVVVSNLTLSGSSADSFAVTPESCEGASVAPGSSCAVEVTFTPTAAGQLTAELIAQLSDGSQTVGQLSGVGAPAPTLDVVPGVAGPNQVVTVIGAGFPAGGTVTIWMGDPTQSTERVVDDSGAVTATFIVPPRRPTGPMAVGVDGQPQSFADVTASLLVSGSRSRSSTAVFNGPATGGR